MKAHEMAAILLRMPADAEVMRRGALDVFEPLEIEGVRNVERVRYEDPGVARDDTTRAWFAEGTLSDRIRKIESREVRQAVILRREEE